MRTSLYEAEDKAALYDAMGNAYLRVMLPTAHELIVDRSGVLAHMRDLHAGRRSPETAADHAALALITGPHDNGDPVTPFAPFHDEQDMIDCATLDAEAQDARDADREAMEACPTCDGSRYLVTDEGDGAKRKRCPPPPDGCGGTGKREGRR